MAQDLTQGAIERFIRYGGLDKVKTDRESVAYLVATGKRLFADEIASQLPNVSIESVKEEYSSEEVLSVKEILDIENLLGQLEDDEQELMRAFLEGLSISELAGKLGLSYDGTAKRLSRTRKKMRNLVKKSAKSRFTG